MQNTNQKSVVKMARILDTNELAQRQQDARQKLLEGYYKSYGQGGGSWIYPCAELKSFQNFEQALQVAQEMSKIGRDLYPHDTPTQTGWHYSASFWRSPEEIEALLQASDAQVAADYQTEIEQFNQQQVELLAEQLVQTELNKEKKKEEEKLNSIKAKALATATQHIQQQLEGK